MREEFLQLEQSSQTGHFQWVRKTPEASEPDLASRYQTRWGLLNLQPSKSLTPDTNYLS